MHKNKWAEKRRKYARIYRKRATSQMPYNNHTVPCVDFRKKLQYLPVNSIANT